MKPKIYLVLIILFLYLHPVNAQDFMIYFSGSGDVSVVTSVKVENLTQNKNLTLDGTDALHLVSTLTGIEIISRGTTNNQIFFSPNPAGDHSRMQFELPESGNSSIIVNDITGKVIIEYRKFLTEGTHTFRIKGMDKGIYIVSIRSGRHRVSGRFLSEGSGKGIPEIVYENQSAAVNKLYENSKGEKGVVEMTYNEGDILKLTGISGDYSTIVTDIPTSSKTVNFYFTGCTDHDGNKYPVVYIGSAKGSEEISESDNKGVQIWMGENLKVKNLNDGTTIPNVTNNQTWTTLNASAYCTYNNVPNDMGLLYNWYTVQTGKLCPAGWHVPTEAEWLALIQYLGGKIVAGGKLKETGDIHWVMGNSGATNSSGFTGLPGGCRLPTDGTFLDMGGTGYFWTSTAAYTDYAYFHSINYFSTVVYGGEMSEVSMKHGFSVRCIKDTK